WASKAQATIASAFNHANNIMLAARGMGVLVIATFFPGGGGTFAALALIALIFVFPILILIWFSKYQWNLQGIDKNHDDLKQSRNRILKAAIVYAVTIIAWPVLSVIVALVIGLFAAM